jgi:hypothetical protein
MRRATRTILVLGVISVVAVVALALMARRYEALLGDRSEPAVRRAAVGIEAEVDRYLDVRRAIQRTIERLDGDRSAAVPDEQTLRALSGARGRALASSGLDIEAYRRIDAECRRLLEGLPPRDDEVRAALDSRRERLAELGLGVYESAEY